MAGIRCQCAIWGCGMRLGGGGQNTAFLESIPSVSHTPLVDGGGIGGAGADASE